MVIGFKLYQKKYFCSKLDAIFARLLSALFFFYEAKRSDFWYTLIFLVRNEKQKAYLCVSFMWNNISLFLRKAFPDRNDIRCLKMNRVTSGLLFKGTSWQNCGRNRQKKEKKKDRGSLSSNMARHLSQIRPHKQKKTSIRHLRI